MNTLSVVIPALNEEDGIGDIIRRVCSIEPRLPKVGIQKLEIIVGDDGCRDRTAEIVTDLAGMAELVDNEIDGLLLRPGDATDLARQLQRLMDNPDVSICLPGLHRSDRVG